MAYDDTQLETDVNHITQQPQWEDEAKRPEFIRGIAAQMGNANVDAQTQTKLLGTLWDQSKGGVIKRGANFVANATGEVLKSIPAGGGAVMQAAGDAVGLTDSGSGTRLKRGVADLWDTAGQRVKQLGGGEILGMNLLPGESKQSRRDGALDALKQDLDEGHHPAGLERWLAGGHDDGSAPDEETQPWVKALTQGMAHKAVAADHMGKPDPAKVRAWMESDRNPAFADSDTGGPGPREMLADYVATRDPASWEAFKARVSETDSQHTTRLQRYANEGEARAVAAAMPEGLGKEMVDRSQDMQTSPIDLATMALPLLRGAKALRAARGGEKAWKVAGKGALVEGGQEAGTEYLQDPNAGAGRVLEAGALGTVGQGVMSGGAASAGYAMRKFQGGTNENVPTDQTTAAAPPTAANGTAAAPAPVGGGAGAVGGVATAGVAPNAASVASSASSVEAMPDFTIPSNSGRAKMAEKILTSQGVDPEAAALVGARLHEQLSPELDTEEFRQHVLWGFQEKGGVLPGSVPNAYVEDPAVYEAQGFTPDEAAEHATNSRIANAAAREVGQQRNRDMVTNARSLHTDLQQSLAKQPPQLQAQAQAQAILRTSAPNPEAFLAKYHAEHGDVIDADQMREMLRTPEHDGHDFTQATDPLVAALSREAARRAIDTMPEGGTVTFLTGGPASGKSHARAGVPAITDGADVMIDAPMATHANAKTMIDRVLAKGGRVAIRYIHTPLEKATSFMMDRFEKTGRETHADKLADMHFRAQQTVLRLAREYAGNPKVDVSVYDNSGAVPKEITPAALAARAYGSLDDAKGRVHTQIDHELDQRSQNEFWSPAKKAAIGRGVQGVGEKTGQADHGRTDETASATSNGGPGASSLNEWDKTTFGQRLRSDERLREAWRKNVGGTYRVESEAEWQHRANSFIEAEGPEAAYAVMTDPDSGLADSDRVAIGLQLILHLDETIRQTELAGGGDVSYLDDLLHETAEWIEQKGTKLGQAVRVFGMWTKMSAEGVLREFERQVHTSREKQMAKKLGKDPAKIADEVSATAAEEHDDVAAEALGETTTEQLADLARQVADLRQQLATATEEASAARLAASQATTPAETAQAERQAQSAEKGRQRAQNELAKAEARQQRKAAEAGKPRAPGQKKPRALNPQGLAARLIAQLEQQQAANPNGQPAGQATQQEVHKLAADYTAGRIDGPAFQAALQKLGINPDSAARLHQLLDDAHAAAAATAPSRQAAALSRQAWEQIDRMTVRHSGGGLPGQPSRSGALSQIIREYLQAKPNALPDFNGQARQLGLEPAEAVELQRLLDLERQAQAVLKQENAKQQATDAFQRQVQGHIDRMTVRHSGGGLPDKPQKTAALSQMIREYIKAKPDALPDFQAQALQLGLAPKDAVELQGLLDKERKALAVLTQERAIARLVDQLTPKLDLKAKERMPRFLKKLFDAHELGALDRPGFLKAYAEAFDLPLMDDATRKRIKGLIEAQKAAPEGFMKQEATTKLMAELAMFKGVAALDILTAFWYGNVLSGITTQGVNVFGNAVHLLLKTLTVGATHNPTETWHFIRGLYEGARRGKVEAGNALKTGNVPYKGDLQFGSGQTLELIHSDNPRTWGERFKNGLALGRFVFRALAAGDAVFYHTAKEGRAHLEAARYAREQTKLNGGNFADYLAEQLANGPTQFQQAQTQAKAELTTAGKTWSKGQVNRRAWEIMEAQRPVDLTAKAARFGDLTTFTHEPEGSMGAVAGLINDAHKRFSLPSPWGPIRVMTPFIPFVNIVANVTSAALDYTPVGMVRGGLGRFTRHTLDRSQVDFDSWEAKQRFASGMLGTLGAGLSFAWALALRDQDDDKVPFMIYGMGPNSKAKRDQMPKGWRPYSLKIGNSYVSYAETPLSLVFAVAGNAMDYLRYNPKGKEERALAATAYALGTSPQALLKTGVLSSVNDLFNLIEGQRSGAQVLTRFASGFIPGQGLLRDISELFHGDKVDDLTLTAGLLKDIPMVRELAGKPPLNVFGEPVKLDTLQRLPIMKRLLTRKGGDEKQVWLAQQKLWVPGMDNQIEVGSYLTEQDKYRAKNGEWRDDRERRLGRAAAGVLTPQERYTLTQTAGPGILQAVKEMQEIHTSFPEATQKQLQERLNGKVVAQRRIAMRKVLGFDR